MFKKSRLKNNTILFLSSYLPLYLIIVIQNISSLYGKYIETLVASNIKFEQVLKSKNLIMGSIKGAFTYLEFYLVIFFIGLIFFSFLIVKYMIKDVKKYSENAFSIKVLGVKNLNYEYVLTYFSAYIFPFITLNLSSISGIIQFSILWLLIGYIYIKNNLVYINPILNIFFKYNIYEANIEYKDGKNTYNEEIILFTKKEKYKLNGRYINVIKENSEYYIEV